MTATLILRVLPAELIKLLQLSPEAKIVDVRWDTLREALLIKVQEPVHHDARQRPPELRAISQGFTRTRREGEELPALHCHVEREITIRVQAPYIGGSFEARLPHVEWRMAKEDGDETS